MSRVSIKTKDDLPAELQPLWNKMTTYGAFENQAGVMAHRPPIFKHTWSLLVDLAEFRHLVETPPGDCAGRGVLVEQVRLLRLAPRPEAGDPGRIGNRAPSGCWITRIIRDSTQLDRLVVEYSIAVNNNWSKTRDEVFVRLARTFLRSPDCRTDLADRALRRLQPLHRHLAMRYRAERPL